MLHNLCILYNIIKLESLEFELEKLSNCLFEFWFFVA